MQQFDQDVKSSIDLQDPLLMQSSIRQQKKIVQKWWLLQRVSSHAEEAQKVLGSYEKLADSMGVASSMQPTSNIHKKQKLHQYRSLI